MEIVGAEFRVRGLVQGVGFRPTVWRLATARQLMGEVLNDGDGVLIRAWGTASSLCDFETALTLEAPPLAHVVSVERRALLENSHATGFRIAESEKSRITTGVVADAATCSDCLKEVFNPADRRYRYPFTNCTHCGPRLSIVRAVPYDRAVTSMSSFEMCDDCSREYRDPADRRFHAEPNACPVCGPKVWLERPDGSALSMPEGQDVIVKAAAQITDGTIVAIKGIGGFHLACDAQNEAAVCRLRQRKRRYDKPFALMARDVDAVRRFAEVNDEEAALLASRHAPIVLLRRLPGHSTLAPGVAPGQTALGFILPYTPLHHILMRELDGPVVLTSGNVSDEPQCVSNKRARADLSGIADILLMHDREIVNRLDDSVVSHVAGDACVIRRARGYAPEPILLPRSLHGGMRVLAMGAELKSTFCLAGDGRAVLSQHVGDLDNPATHSDYRAALRLYREIFSFDPDVIAIDKHPDYMSSKWGRALAEETGARLMEVQHHHAHIAAVLAEHGRDRADGAVQGVVLDGLGMGDGGELWGGEFLRADYARYERLAAFDAVPLIGGDKAAREPWRNAFAHVHRAFGWAAFEAGYPDNAFTNFMRLRQTGVLLRMIETGLNAPEASSAGRLFDAVAAVLGLCTERVTYEGQAAIALEAAAQSFGDVHVAGYPVAVRGGQPLRILWRPYWEALLGDLSTGVDRGLIAMRAHQGVAQAVINVTLSLCSDRGVCTSVLSGGVFQNRILHQSVVAGLRAKGLEVLMPCAISTNDGGISLGQAAVASALVSGAN
jgi:hydrogenase maturation protein HypF